MTYESFIELANRLLSNLSDLSDSEIQYVLDNSELDMYDIRMLKEMLRHTEDKDEVEDYLHGEGVDIFYLFESLSECVEIQDKIIDGEISTFC